MTARDVPPGTALANSELARLATLESLGLLDTPSEREFDAIVAMAQRLTGAKIALISLVDKDRQWFKAKIGVDLCETSRETAFCDRTIETDEILIVPDASKDSRFADNPHVTGHPGIRFYAGFPIRADRLDQPAKRVPLGTLCVIDDEPRQLNAQDITLLTELAHLVEALISARTATAAANLAAEERSRHLDALNRKHRQLRQAERIANIGSWRLTLADNQTEWSEQTYAIHGVAIGDGRALDAALDFYPGKARSMIVNAIERTTRTGEPFDLETDFLTAQGDFRRVRSMGELELDNGQPVALVGVFQDITVRHAMEEALRRAAYTDELTRIASRARFNEFVDERLRVATAAGEKCALLLIDLDHFKAVNDRCGHHAGDDVLRIMASRLQASYLSNCFAARLGGDEFVLLVSDQDILKDLPALLQRLLGDLRHSVGASGFTLEVTATIGACWLSAATKTRSELLRNADTALYAAKKRQRGSAMITGSAQAILHDQPLPLALRLVGP